MTEQPIYEFTMRATEADPSGYYYPRWDLAREVIIRGSTKSEAVNKAAAMLGPTRRRSGWRWTFKIDRIREVTGE